MIAPWPEAQQVVKPAFHVSMQQILERLASLHTRLCPRQVLGARIGLLGGELLGLELPRTDKRLLTLVETDGCFVDGVLVATGCRVGRRTMRVLDYGKTAAAFVDVETGEAVRVRPRSSIRELACRSVPTAIDPWHAQLEAYQWLPAADLLEAQPAMLPAPLPALLGRPGLHIPCVSCGEEIMNDRQIEVAGQAWCRACRGVSGLA